jgi:hypothetical protein
VARKFLTPIDMTGLEIQKLRIENATSNPTVASGTESVFKGRVFFNSSTNKLYYYNGTAWQATGLVSITLGGDLSGTATTDVDGNVTLNATINANSIALGTDTTGNYVATVASSGGTITVTGSGSETAAVNVDLPNTGVTAGSYGSTTEIPTFTVDAQGRLTAAGTVSVATTLSIAGDTGTDTVNLLTDTLTVSGGEGIDVAVTNNTITVSAEDATTTNKGVASFDTNDFTVTSGAVTIKNVNLGTQTTGDYVANIQGTTNEVTVTPTSGEGTSVTIGLPDDVTITNNLNVGGNLNVTGSINAVSTTEINIQDNKINLNSNFNTGTPTADAGIKVNRGDEADVELKWDETDNRWELTNDGTNYHAITRKFVDVVGDGVATSYAVTHNLGTRDVTVQVYDSATYESVETGVTRTSDSVATLVFAVAPASGAYRVVITG